MWKLVLAVSILGVTVSSIQVLDPFQLREGKTAHYLNSGTVELVDTKTIRIQNLNYDGTGPDAFWIIGYGNPPSERPNYMPGYKIPNEQGNCEVLQKYRDDTIQLVLPGELTVNNVDWLAMYCVKYKHTFGWVDLREKRNGNRFQGVKEAPGDTVLPKSCQQSTGVLDIFKLQEGPTAHNLKSSPVELINIKTIRIPNLNYDGKGPDAYWMVGSGNPPIERPKSTPGYKIPNEAGRCDILKKYNGETVELILPDNYTVNNIDWLGMYCIYYKHTFGWVNLKKARSGSEFGELAPLPPSILPPKPCGQPKLSGTGFMFHGIIGSIFLNWAFPFLNLN